MCLDIRPSLYVEAFLLPSICPVIIIQRHWIFTRLTAPSRVSNHTTHALLRSASAWKLSRICRNKCYRHKNTPRLTVLWWLWNLNRFECTQFSIFVSCTISIIIVQLSLISLFFSLFSSVKQFIYIYNFRLKNW